MQLILEVRQADFFHFTAPGGGNVLVLATGSVNSTGWSNIRLSPRFYVKPPADGIWDFDFVGEEPGGIVLPVILPVSASYTGGAPDWLKGVRVHASQGSVTASDKGQIAATRAAPSAAVLPDISHVIVRQRIAVYEDSWQPIGHCGGLSVKMKKLVHELFLIVEGPDEAKIRRCIEEAAGVGLIAAIIAVFATGGGALSAAVSAFLSHLTNCLGNGFSARFEDSSHWVEWCT